MIRACQRSAAFRVVRSTAVVCALLVSRSAIPADVGDVTKQCAAMQKAVVEVRGDLVLYRGETSETIKDFRAGSGFWVDPNHIVTADHVVDRMVRIEVCSASGECQQVDGVVSRAEADLAVLHVPGPAPALFRIGSPVGPGQAVIAAGYPGDVGFVCGPGHVTSADEGKPWVFFDGTVAAEGSSGGPIALVDKKGKKLVAIGAVSGGQMVGTVQFDRGTRLDLLLPAIPGDAVEPSAWRDREPWAEVRPADLQLVPGRAVWEDLEIPGLQDVEVQAAGEGACVGLYHPPSSLFADADPEAIAWSCEGKAVRYTTRSHETVRVGLWTNRAEGFTGRVELRIR